MTQPSSEDLHRADEAAMGGPPPPEEALPRPDARHHTKLPEGHHDDAYALAAKRAEVDAGIRDYVPEDVPPAEEPLPDDLAADLDET